jgi:hypothetical protein
MGVSVIPSVCTKAWMIVALVALLTSLFFVAVPVNAAYSWSYLDGATVDSPAVVGIYGERVDVIVRGTDNGVHHKYWTSTGGWSGWINLHGSTVDKPAVAYADYEYKDTLHVVVRGTNNALYHKKFDIASATWDSSWTWLDPIAEPWLAASAPALTTFDYNGECLFMIFRGQDNYLRYAWFQDYWRGFAGKTWLDGLTTDIPAVATYDNKIQLVVRGMDDSIYYREGTPENAYIQWSASWEKLPGTTLSAPTLWADDYYGLHLFVRGSNNAVYWRDIYSDMTSWISLGGATCDRPAFWIEPESIWRGDWCLNIRGMNNEVYRKYRVWNYDSSTYEWETVWTPMNGQTLSAPDTDNYCLIVRGTNNGVYMANSLWG